MRLIRFLWRYCLLSGSCKGVNALEGDNQTVYSQAPYSRRWSHSQRLVIGPDPDNYPTTLDANRSGRVAFVTGNVEVTMDSLSFTGGLANAGEDGNNGGGIWTDTNLILRIRRFTATQQLLAADFTAVAAEAALSVTPT